MFRVTQHNLALSDVNPDHLQMALALSKSTYATEYQGLSKDMEDDCPAFLSPEKIPKVKTTLERYGFKSNKPKLNVELRRQPIEVTKKNKNSKFRYITPTLKIRTEDERQMIITSKISLILCDSTNVPCEKSEEEQGLNKLYSGNLKRYRQSRSLFSVNRYGLEVSIENYYNKELNMSPAKSKCGCLLKKWENIPGREKSPTPTKIKDIEVDNQVICINNDSNNSTTSDLNSQIENSTYRGISPDLFDSESESECYLKERHDLSQSLLSPLKPERNTRFSSGSKSWEQNKSGDFSKKQCINSPCNKEAVVGTQCSNSKTLEEDAEDSYLNYIKTSLVENSFADSPVKKNENYERQELLLATESVHDTNKINLTFSSSSNDSDFTVHTESLKNYKTDFMEKYMEHSTVENLHIGTHFEVSHHSSENLEHEDEAGSFEINTSTEYNKCNLTVSNFNSESTALENQDKSILKKNDYDTISSSQESSHTSINISDEELNYSSFNSKHINKDVYNISDDECNENSGALINTTEIYLKHLVLKNKYRNKISSPLHNRISEHKSASPIRNVSPKRKLLEDSFNAVSEHPNLLKAVTDKTNATGNFPLTDNYPNPHSAKEASTPDQKCFPGTPNNNFIIKTTDITPFTNYDEMDTPKIRKELQKFGLKPLKRQRGVKLLKYLYECTHPLMGPDETEEHSSDEDNERVIKKKKSCDVKWSNGADCPITQFDSKYDQDNIEIIGDDVLKNENLDELIFERKYSVKILSCRIPLQLIWHNFLSQNRQIKEDILLYEPLQLEVVHGMLKEQTGCKFHIQDLLKFFDRKCIAIRTAQGGKPKTEF
ncbi:hypothetical protein NQ315_009139 [Exocentrus adspersus]|uniref:Structure-specific endonuclease subunit SLX4 n=1 Tax=Exocentrus adspersus TaxID=1586481 RepID=A0AAV8WFJ2_9CUCU|nr:hypothetical protein NQ315_009139 [Exocentrus adspersus]